MACTYHSPAQPNPVGSLALPLQISKRYLGTYLDAANGAPAASPETVPHSNH